MIRHVILWTFDSKLTEDEKKSAAAEIKEQLESLCGVIDGLKQCSVYTERLDSSSADIMLDSVFENEAALAAYQTHPEHLKVKDLIVSVVCDRKCLDFPVIANDI